MKEKLLPVLVALLMLSSVFVALVNQKESIVIKAEASGGGSTGTGGYEPIINYTYVWHKTQNLSYIVKEHPKGRAFGTKGERIAANRIWQWMNETLEPENVTREKIKETLRFWDVPIDRNVSWGIWSSVGKLNKVRMVDAHWINITVEGADEYWNLTYKEDGISDCFPLLATACPYSLPDKVRIVGNKTYFIWNKKDLNVTGKPVSKKGRYCIVAYTDWKHPWQWNIIYDPDKNYFLPSLKTKYKAFILVDKDFDNTSFMGPAYKMLYPKPGYSINGSVWRDVENYLLNDSYKVKAHIYSKWHWDFVESYNIIGKLEGRNSSKVDIVCAHYDCWWNQGTIDEAAETALVLGIAKYMKKLEEEKGIKPEHTVKFIAFGGEEFGFRGSLDYIIKHVKSGEEKVRYVINPGNFGHTDSKELPADDPRRNFNISSDRDFIGEIGSNLADALRYNERFDWNAQNSSEIEAEDSKAFYALQKAYGVVQFGRGPFKGYHRDGSNHTEGDVLTPKGPFCGLVNDTFTIESDIVLLTALYLCYEDVIKENLTILDSDPETFDSGNDGRHDSVRIHFNVSSVIPTGAKITVDIFNASNITECVASGYTTRYFLIGENGTTHGYIDIILPSLQSPGNYTAKLKLYDVNGTLVDEDWTESFFLNLLDVPIADFKYAPSKPTDIENITFDAEHHSYPSAPENGSNTSKIVNYTWDFGDGSYGYGGIVTHRYADDGYYNVTLTIIDSNGKNASITKQIYVRNVPQRLISLSHHVGV